MNAGRPRLPTAIHELRGTARPDRINAAEPKPRKLTRATPPSFLKGHARKAWKQLSPILIETGVLTDADLAALSLLCDAYGEYMLCNEAVDRHGPFVETTNMHGDYKVVTHPAVIQRSDAWRRVAAMMQQFGLTPAARAKVSRVDAAEVDPLEAWMRGG